MTPEHTALVAELLKQHNYHDSLEHRAAAAIRELEEVAARGARLAGEQGVRLALMTQEIERRTAEVAALRKALNEIHGHLYAANIQRAPSDDRIIAEHIATALACSSAALADKPRFTDGRGNDIGHLVDP